MRSPNAYRVGHAHYRYRDTVGFSRETDREPVLPTAIRVGDTVPTPALIRGLTARRGGSREAAASLLHEVGELFILTKDLRVLQFREVMNYAQRDFIEEVAHQLSTTGQVRIVVLKARQIGITTVIEAIIYVLTQIHDNLRGLIVSHESDSAEAILTMTQRYWETDINREFHDTKYDGRKQLAWTTGSQIQVATAKNVAAGRSKTIQALHASEVAFWDDPEKLMTGLRQSIPNAGISAIFIESTANGVGNYFQRMCNSSMLNDSEYKFKFYPWWKHPEYDALFLPLGERHRYQLNGALTDKEEIRLRQIGVSDSRLVWRRYAIRELCQGDILKFHQEYPSTPHEAFISSGRNVFPLTRLLDHYQPRKGLRGQLVRARGKIEFIELENGPLTLYSYPSRDTDWGIYIAGCDPTHTTAGDYACIQVINRRTLEQVAVYRRKVDPITFGKDAQLLGHYYHDALLAPEKEGPGYATVGCIVGDGYTPVYRSHNIAKTPGHPTTDLHGWSTNAATKHVAISHVLRAISAPLADYGGHQYGLVIHDQRTLTEMRDYVTKEDGSGYCNSDGSEYDDGVMAFAIALAVHNIEPATVAYETREPYELPPNVARLPVAQDFTSGTSDLTAPDDLDIPTGPPETITPEAPWEAWGNER